MKMYIAFGDYSGDGHCQWDRVLVDAPSKEHLIMAQEIVRNTFGEHLFKHMAKDYQEPYFGEEVWDALITTGYPIENLRNTLDGYNLDDVESLQGFIKEETNPNVNIEFVIDSFIWLLNWAGANIRRLDSKEDIPTVNWAQGFQTVGYGCYD